MKISPRPTNHSLVRLKDGRDLSFCEFGASNGFPVFYFHGTPSCRLEAGFANDAAQHFGFRLIATDRPGFGRSKFQKGRKFKHWPDDILALAKYLDIDQFGVVGHSGAGPHLFACGAFIDPDRLKFIGALGPWGPVASPEIMEDLNRLDRAFARLAHRMPWMMRVGFAPMGWAARFSPGIFFRLLKRSVSRSDQVILERPEIAERFRAMQAEAFRQGSRGAAQEASLAYSDWGFDIGTIRVPTHIWLGEEDIFVTNAMGRHMARTIPNVDFHWVAGAGHLNFDNWNDIFTACRNDLE
ncbi:alpha/beta fold hydrolase [Rhodophyticola sp.]|jgi:pimeloyl-ACP methyl ester carboxylesterase|uniref:alpha/beta fold hydrolase n=1 Tax=Rhodophyticola sp. TaxID=2680032 RepID=UPI003D294658